MSEITSATASGNPEAGKYARIEDLEAECIKSGSIHIEELKRAAELYEQVFEDSEKASKEAPSDIKLGLNYVTLLVVKNDMQGAIREMERLIALAPADHTLRIDAAHMLMFVGEYKKALEHVRFCITNGCRLPAVYVLAARAYIMLDKPKAADMVLEMVPQEDAGNQYIQLLRGIARYKSAEHSPALDVLQHAVRGEKTDGAVLAFMATAIMNGRAELSDADVTGYTGKTLLTMAAMFNNMAKACGVSVASLSDRIAQGN